MARHRWSADFHPQLGQCDVSVTFLHKNMSENSNYKCVLQVFPLINLSLKIPRFHIYEGAR